MLSCPNQQSLKNFLEGRLLDPEIGSVADHITQCGPCRQALSTMSAQDALLDAVHCLKDNTSFSQQQPQVEALVLRICSLLPAKNPDAFGSTLRDQDTTPPVSGPHPPIPSIPGYEILGLLGQGGMGTVFKARHTHLGKIMALKLLSSRGALSDAALSGFRKEMKAIGGLNHPHIVQAHDAGEADGVPYLALEYLEGTDLAQLVQEGSLPIADACEIARQAALGLQHAHEHGLVHRDLKPSNLLLTKDGSVKILDLGLARFGEGERAAIMSDERPQKNHLLAAHTRHSSALGTPAYLAPEQWLNAHTVDIRADLYGLGCTLYHLLAGRPPFEGQDTLLQRHAHLLERPTPIRELRPDVPLALADLVERLLAKDPAQRPALPSELAQALEPHAAGSSLRHLPQASGKGSGGAVAGAATPGLQHAAGLKRRHSFWKRHRLAVAVVLLAITLFAAAVLAIATDRGTLVIQTNEPDVAVLVKQDGKTVQIVDQKSGKEITLRSGAYELALSGGKAGLKLSADRFVLTRGDREVVKVYLEPPGLAGATALKTIPAVGGRWVRKAPLPLAARGCMAATPGSGGLPCPKSMRGRPAAIAGHWEPSTGNSTWPEAGA
jgi:serine/threonine protein kinase